ncbi:MAG: tRNA glutamyl-Q(34) synthetase GluQRS [Planctomycetes bacterium]|nr:tRNA glutamyl-Q(34) synthetase GluQRS [Planctomycetota bacterium]MCB9903962.1 tRNA glutamyl-Q(34) synthetase GluQRS [Planctomycetota bacterium]
MQEPRTVGRLAPSPTGRLHVGHARSFLIAWWSVRAAGGRVVLRLEDLDRSRVRQEYVDGVLRDLEWLGLDWDGVPLSQYESRAALHAAAEDLLARGLAYPCVCTRREVQEAIAAPHAGDVNEVYPGTCRDRFASVQAARAESGREPALRFRVAPGVVEFDDLLHGPQRQDVASVVGDFPITSRDGQVAYQLAVVVDDARQGVNEVLRGDDLLDSTARQGLLQRALGLASPRWGHLGLVVDESGRRLAKRADDLSLERLRDEGVDPRRLVAWIADGFELGAGEPLPAEAWIARFRLPSQPESAIRFDRPELDALLSGRVPAARRSSGPRMS